MDQLYAFFVQWKPELYGDDEEISAERRGFVVLEDEDKEDPNEMDVIEEYFNNGITALQKDWEVGVGAIIDFMCGHFRRLIRTVGHTQSATNHNDISSHPLLS